MPWFKGNIHTHTTNSDGDSSPEHVSEWYKNHDYDFLVLSDHNHLTILEEDKKNQDIWPLLVPGEEITVRTIGTEAAALHINGIGISEVILPNSYESNIEAIEDVVSRVKNQNGLASINHPNYQWWVSSEDIKHAKVDPWGFEVFNGHMHANNEGSLSSMSTEEIWDDILSSGKFIYGIASDDSHHFTQEFSSSRSNPGRGWVVVNSKSLSVDEIINSFRIGEFYSSTGVELSEITTTEEKIKIKIKDGISKDKSKFTFRVIHENGVIFHEEEGQDLEIGTKGIKKYYRVVISSSQGTKAWTQPILL